MKVLCVLSLCLTLSYGTIFGTISGNSHCERKMDSKEPLIRTSARYRPEGEQCAYVHMIKPLPGQVPDTCRHGIDYGVETDNAWVRNAACEGRYKVAFIHGICEDMEFDSDDEFLAQTLTEPCVNGNICSMEVKSISANSSDCTLGYSYGFSGTEAWVDFGCKATFTVCELANYANHH